MRRNIFFLGMLVCLLALGFVACSKKEGGSSSGGKANPASDFQYDLNSTGDGIIIKKYIGKNGGKVVIPSEIEGFPVKEIGWLRDIRGFSSVFSEPTNEWIQKNPDRGFGGNSDSRKTRITSIFIPDTVTLLGSGSFSDCESLKEITLPKSLQIIDQGTFAGSGLTSIIIPEGVIEIRENAFLGCKNLVSVTIPESIVKIGSGAFQSCASLTEIKLPSHSIQYGQWWDGRFEAKQMFGSFEQCPKLSIATRQAITNSGYTGTF